MTDIKGKIDTVSLDMNLDDIEDLPQFVQLPTGAYTAVLLDGITAKDMPTASGAQPLFEMKFTLMNVEEVSPDALNKEEEEEMPKPGDIASFIYQRDNAFGMGLFKDIVKPIAKRLGVSQVGALLEGSKGMECAIIVVREFNKDKQKYYSRLKKLVVL